MKKVAIVGFSGKSIHTLWPDDVEIWTINCAWDGYGFTRIDRLFEMHPISQLSADLERATKWEGKHWIWLQEEHEFPIYMMQADPRIPASAAYPLDEICADVFGHLRRGDEINRYMTSSASYMAAMAIQERFDVIYVAGLEMASGSEYTYQRDGFTYLLGVAAGRGIDVVLSEKSALMRAKLYSYEGGQMVAREVIGQHLENYQAQFDAMIAENSGSPSIYRAQGAVLALSALMGNSDLPYMGRQGLEHTLQKYGQQHSETMGYCNKFGPEKFGAAMMMSEGAIQAYENLIDVCDLQEPNLAIHEIAHFISLEKLEKEG